MTKPKRRLSKKEHAPHLFAPSVWPTWLLIGLAWLIVRLPLAWVSALGRGSGSLLYRVAPGRRKITLRNLELCFPDLDETERIELAKQTFKNIGSGTLELMIPWLNPGKSLMHRFSVEGHTHLTNAVAQGRGVLLIGGHYAVMDIICAPLARCGPIDVMYRFNKNPAWEWLQVKGRRRYFDGVIERQDTRQVLRRLRKGRVVWYAPDQDYGAKHSVFVPFFGNQAATITATSRFAGINDSAVVFYSHYRNEDNSGYHLHFSPALENYPTGDQKQDAITINRIVEEAIRKQPDQYLWLHKRFKTQATDKSARPY